LRLELVQEAFPEGVPLGCVRGIDEPEFGGFRPSGAVVTQKDRASVETTISPADRDGHGNKSLEGRKKVKACVDFPAPVG